jgi:hypothetical protein
MMKRDYGVYIIEAIGSEDLPEGDYLKEILEANSVMVIHEYISSKEEFRKAIIGFDVTNFRYLHISCHGLKDEIGFDLVNEEITIGEIESIIKGKMQNRRISLSVCVSGRKEISEVFIKDGAYSVIGHPDAVDSSKASLFWTNFYLLMNNENKWSMERKYILHYLKSLSTLLRIPIHYYSFIRKEWKDNLIRVKISSKGLVKKQKIKIQ